MAGCCLTGAVVERRNREPVSDAFLSGHCQKPPSLPLSLSPSLLLPTATGAEVKNRRSLVTLHVNASHVWRADTYKDAFGTNNCL